MSTAANAFGFPSDFVSPKEKAAKSYGLDYARAIWWSFGGLSFYDDRKARFAELRRWAEGTQSTEDMKDMMSTAGDTSNLNLDWSPISILPKFVDIIVSRITSSIYNVHCSATDPISVNIKDKQKNELYANMFLKQVEQQTGVKLVPEGAFIPEDSSEAEIYMDLTYKMAVELAMETGIQYILDKNKFEEICQKIVRDLVTLKIGILNIKYNKAGRISLEYVDPVNAVTPRTMKDDFSDITYFAFVEWTTIGALKRDAGNEFTEEEYYDIAEKTANLFGNNIFGTLEDYYSYTNTNRYYYNFLIPVLNFKFLSINTENWKSKKNEYGTSKLYPIDNSPKRMDIKAANEKEAIQKLKSKVDSENEKIVSVVPKKNGSLYVVEYTPIYSPDNEDTEVLGKDIQDKYEGKWIANTDYIYGYGLARNMVRKKEMGQYDLDTTLGCKIIAPNLVWMDNKSHVERGIPYAKQMQLQHLKLQQMTAKARPKGLIIDISGLQEVMLGKGGGKGGQDKSATPLELQAIYDQTGNQYINRINTAGDHMNGLPIQEIENGLGKDVLNYINIYNFNLKVLQDMLGVPEGLDASAPDGSSPVFGMKQAGSASQAALQPLVKGYVRLVENTSYELAYMIQDSIEDDVNNFALGMGESAKMIIELSKEIPLCEFGIKIEYYPDEQSRLYLEQRINNAEAKGDLRFEDAMMAQFIKNPKMLAVWMTQRRKIYQKEEMEKAKALSENQGQSAAQAAQLAEQAKQKTIEVQSKADYDLMAKEYLLKEEFEKTLSMLKIQQINAQAAATAKADIVVANNTPKEPTNAVRA